MSNSKISDQRKTDYNVKFNKSLLGNLGTVCFTCNHLGADVSADDTLYDVITYTDCGDRICCIQKDTEIQEAVRLVST